MAQPPKRDVTTMQISPKTREAIKKKKRGDETYDGFFRRVFRL